MHAHLHTLTHTHTRRVFLMTLESKCRANTVIEKGQRETDKQRERGWICTVLTDYNELCQKHHKSKAAGLFHCCSLCSPFLPHPLFTPTFQAVGCQHGHSQGTSSSLSLASTLPSPPLPPPPHLLPAPLAGPAAPPPPVHQRGGGVQRLQLPE